MEEINYEKAWQMLKEEKTNNELDGTHEFSNLLDDMNREDK